MSDTWYYADQGKQVGPFGIQQLKAALLRIPNAGNVLVWSPGFTDWKRAGDVAELAAETSAPAPFAERIVPAGHVDAASAVKPTILQLWFGFRGRANRAKYWMVILGNLALMVVAFGVGFAMGAERGWYLVTILMVAVLISAFAIGVKRLHDRNKSAWWMLLYGLLPIILSVVGVVAEVGGNRGVATPVNLLSTLISIAVFIDLGCLRGTIGDNRFGPDPLAGRN